MNGQNEMQHLNLDIEVKQISHEGGFEGYASVMTVDRGNDIVDMGAFDRSLARHKRQGTMPKMLWQHDPGKVIGVWTDMQQDEKGLFVKGYCVKSTTLGKDCHELLKAGAIDSMSIGYLTKEVEFEEGGDIRRLKEVDLWEVSLVTFPMNVDARVTDTATAVKRVESIRDAERALREGGAGSEFAKLCALYGFAEAKKRVDGTREADVGAVEQAGAARLMRNLKARVRVI